MRPYDQPGVRVIMHIQQLVPVGFLQIKIANHQQVDINCDHCNYENVLCQQYPVLDSFYIS
jgi:hypothetical protein